MPTPTHKIEIVKRMGLEQWSNDWLCVAVDMNEAQDIASELVTFERNLHSSDVTFEYALISTYAPEDRIFRHDPLNEPGLAGATAGTGLPLFNTLRVDLQTTDSDPGRKYFRLPIVESYQEDGQLTSSVLTVFAATIATHLAPTIATGVLVTPVGNTIVGATPHPFIQMRQLHRRRRPVVAP